MLQFLGDLVANASQFTSFINSFVHTYWIYPVILLIVTCFFFYLVSDNK